MNTKQPSFIFICLLTIVLQVACHSTKEASTTVVDTTNDNPSSNQAKRHNIKTDNDNFTNQSIANPKPATESKTGARSSKNN